MSIMNCWVFTFLNQSTVYIFFFYINNLPHFFFFFFFFFFPDDSFSSPSLTSKQTIKSPQYVASTGNNGSIVCKAGQSTQEKSQQNYSWTMTSHKKNRPSSPSSSFSWSSKACCSNCFSTLLMTASPSPFAFSVNYNHTEKTQKYCDSSALLFNNN